MHISDKELIGPVHEVVPLRIAAESRIVREHLDRVLSGSAFRQSRRYAAVLRFMVERGLEGSEPHLKEREIGSEVFGRAPDYDTSTDHVVRSAAAEVRKRLAQYYQEDGVNDFLRIDLHRGSYVPQFRVVSEQEPLYAPLLKRRVVCPIRSRPPRLQDGDRASGRLDCWLPSHCSSAWRLLDWHTKPIRPSTISGILYSPRIRRCCSAPAPLAAAIRQGLLPAPTAA